jgi:hypothetical protein
VVLPGEVRARRAGDDGAEIGVADRRDRGEQLGAQRDGWRDHARGAPLRRSLGQVERTDAETKAVDGVTPHAEAGDQLRREHLELVRPGARRDLHEQDAALERDGVRAVGDPRADRDLPLTHRDGGPAPREAILAGAVQQRLHRLRGVEVLAATPLGGPGHRPRW